MNLPSATILGETSSGLKMNYLPTVHQDKMSVHNQKQTDASYAFVRPLACGVRALGASIFDEDASPRGGANL